ncbi:MAG TPA: histidine--tRNA ligase [Actinomycetota bacterium]|nr:histidine--tRNA ligase [Actinomycetota bacterium]
MEPSNTRPPSGMRDFLPAEVKAREKVLSTVRGVFESYGFAPLETPAIERLEILQGKYGEEGDRLIFKIAQRGARATEEADLALRYDLTVPLARVVAEYGDRTGKIFKRYQVAPVWRADRPGRGRFREFYQCDVDVVGPEFGLADAETILVLTDALAALGLKGFEVRLNSRKVLRGLIESYGIDPARETDVLVALDKFDKIGEAGVREELDKRGVHASRLLLEIARPGDALRRELGESEIGRTGLDEVDRLIDLVGPLVNDGAVTFSPVLARGLSYYTGPIFEVYVAEGPLKGPDQNPEGPLKGPDQKKGSTSAISSGGRYDGLVGMFAGRSIPAVGGSLGIERIIPLVSRAEEGVVSPAKVFLAVWDAAARPDALATASALRAAGIPTEVYLGDERSGHMGEQLGYASSRGIPYAVLRGPKEKELGVVTLRDLQTREQTAVPEGDLTAVLRDRLST